MLTKEDLSIYKVTSKDATRPVLTSVLFRKYQEDSASQWFIKLAATDGYRLAQKLVPVDYEPTFDELLIPAATIQDLCKQLNKHRRVLVTNGQFQILNTKHNPEGILERTISLGEVIEGKYPEYEGLIPTKDPKASVLINPKYMKDAIAQHGDEKLTINVNEPLEATVIRSLDSRDVETMTVVMPLKS